MPWLFDRLLKGNLRHPSSPLVYGCYKCVNYQLVLKKRFSQAMG
ncbi:hypothetical protein VSVS12_01929 [Vibrio scophthalmi]|nr:hypothetical protein VSVS12_01929 [Vibrio scophthalmi]